MAGLSLQCGDCKVQLRTVEEAQEHAELTGHANFEESTEPVLNLVCSTCGKPCRTKTESDLHTKRTGHTEFVDKTAETAKPVVLEIKPDGGAGPSGSSSGDGSAKPPDLVVPEVNKELLAELEGMGFSTARATRSLHFSGADNIEGAVTWIVEHEGDDNIDEMPMVPAGATGGAVASMLTPEEAKAKAQELRERARKKKDEEEKRMEKEREKLSSISHGSLRAEEIFLFLLSRVVVLYLYEQQERIRIGREMQEARRIEEDNERKRIMILRKAEKEEEKRAREKIRLKLEEDKAERRRKLGLPPEEPQPATSAPAPIPKEEKKSFVPLRPASKAEQMRTCLRGMKQAHKDEDDKVKKAFQTLLTYLGNVVRSPDEEKFRKIRLTNPTFQERVGNMGGVSFLELCGFEKDTAGEFLSLAREKVDVMLLNTAGAEINSALVNPFFGVL
ncbi:hypothetical protein AXG93_2550s1560 [Marchantia polymorpha subsp. ruderalis]|uniref:UBA domain-containing protein n=1 Tax=Marchantia polymorpha subsp. ruderalis TaxID=1480154 RepID=A0A176VMJ1_MARPO|nr:hypothetical protein AXG93_2550s1560 [Marchantia polymorpha subsp. ruderalis]